MSGTEGYFYAAVGAQLRSYAIDADKIALTQVGVIELPAWVQYAWRHPRLPILYAVSSDGGPASGREGEVHHASALTIDPATGTLSHHGPAAALDSRPIHCSLDRNGDYLLTAYNDPSTVSVHRVAPDGTLGEKIAQDSSLECGVYAHQVLATPSNDAVIVPARGHDAKGDAPEDPGALYLFDFENGQLSPTQRIAPGDGTGYGFGPRHLDFHPHNPWVYVSVERQNQLQLYTLDEPGRLSHAPLFSRDALAQPEAQQGPQMSSAVRAHANGRFVYQANRTNELRHDADGWSVSFGGENNIVVWSLDAETGEPSAIQHMDVPGIHVRTLSLHSSGKLLAAATISPVPVRESNGGVRLVPAAIMLFRVRDDGRIELARKYDIDTRGQAMWWTGFVQVGA